MNETEFAKARRNMVDSQLLPNRITDERLIEAMGSLPRERFLPSARRALAYADDSILIESDRYLMQPMILARLLEIAEIKSTDVALLIGGASGYGVAVLSKLVDTVVAVESDGSLRQKAERTLSELGIDNVAVIDGKLAAGHPKEAPYDVIVIDGAVPEVPAEISRQLAEGGRLVAVERAPHRRVGRGILIARFGESLSKREVFDAAEPILPGFEKEAAFSF